MTTSDSERSTYDLLEGWRDQLQVTYVRVAAQIARFERSNQVPSDRDLYGQLDRLERDIARAEYALKLFRAQHMQVLLPMLLKREAEAA